MTDIECAYCGAEYTAKRSSSKYCSGSCRTMANRKRRKDETLNIALQNLVADGNAKLESLFQKADLQLKELMQKSDTERDERDRIKNGKSEADLKLKADQKSAAKEKRDINQQANIEKDRLFEQTFNENIKKAVNHFTRASQPGKK